MNSQSLRANAIYRTQNLHKIVLAQKAHGFSNLTRNLEMPQFTDQKSQTVDLLCPCKQFDKTAVKGTILLCGVSKETCPSCSNIELKWSKLNDSCIHVDRVDISRNNCVTSLVPFYSERLFCLGQVDANTSTLKVKRQKICDDNISADSRIFIDYNESSAKISALVNGLINVDVATDMYSCPTQFLEIAEGRLRPVSSVVAPGALPINLGES